MKEKIYIVIIGLAVIFMIGGSIGSLKARATEKREQDFEYVKKVEQDYKKMIQDKISEEGIYYSGITITRVSDHTETLYYKIKVHNKKIDELSKERQAELIQKLENVKAPGQISEIRKEFVMN